MKILNILENKKVIVVIFSFSLGIFANSFAAEIPELEELVDISKPVFFTGTQKWLPAPDMLPEGALVQIIDGNPAEAGPFTMRIKLPENYEIPAHWNFSDEHITVISGTLNLGLGDKLEKSKCKKSTAGSYLRIPAKMHHFAWNKEETIIQLHGMGPWGVQYLGQNQDKNQAVDEANIERDYDAPDDNKLK